VGFAGAAGRIVTGSTILATGLGFGTTALQPAAAAALPALRRAPVVVGFGDSVPAGEHCGCLDFVHQYAASVGARTATRPVVHNYARGGSTSADVVKLLRKSGVDRAVERASAVVIMTGANDYIPAFHAVGNGASASRYKKVARAVEHNVSAAVRRIHRLNPSAEVVIVDYWAAMEDGKVAERDYNRAQRAAAWAATKSVDHALWSVANSTSARFVSTYLAFHRAAADVTRLLAPDGDHPDALGTTVIADALSALLPG
jgi:lysophospholipase L1-like esterase